MKRNPLIKKKGSTKLPKTLVITLDDEFRKRLKKLYPNAQFIGFPKEIKGKRIAAKSIDFDDNMQPISATVIVEDEFKGTLLKIEKDIKKCQ